MNIAQVQLWGRMIGAVSLDEGRDVAAFEYDPEFARSGIQLSPLTMPLSEQVYEFPALPPNTFHGLPGLLADSLPDKFGNALIDAWLATQGRTPGSFNAVERLCYTGKRGMGALEFSPAQGPTPGKAAKRRMCMWLAPTSTPTPWDWRGINPKWASTCNKVGIWVAAVRSRRCTPSWTPHPEPARANTRRA